MRHFIAFKTQLFQPKSKLINKGYLGMYLNNFQMKLQSNQMVKIRPNLFTLAEMNFKPHRMSVRLDENMNKQACLLAARARA
jgi:hypothetical protein